ncbi:TetR/AcrR family transcriptional regulator [Rhizobium sp. SL86]|uniref:TetR/AcrR family transcriptional regulator n=1 Tax=Rhizobium sp. SL86 TaxID=2995148 RepID=UPI0022735794|nr:TetR/AcrR family transcriptional regulator [Rhizobium sp. SL86]MCY1666709.1 helix-turn-helix domain containing protein [Rhizobium sp. SL86]
MNLILTFNRQEDCPVEGWHTEEMAMSEAVAKKMRGRVGRPARDNQDGAAERIIEAATELFASRGFAGTSMEQVASRCGAGKDTLYRRYPSKVVLFEAVVEHARRRTAARLSNLPSMQGNALERLKVLLREMLRINMDPDLIALKRITFSEAIVFDKAAPVAQQPDPIMEHLVGAVGDAQTAGFIEDGETRVIAEHLIYCLVAQPTTAAMLGATEFNGAAAEERHFERTWTWLLNGVAAAR